MLLKTKQSGTWRCSVCAVSPKALPDVLALAGDLLQLLGKLPGRWNEPVPGLLAGGGVVHLEIWSAPCRGCWHSIARGTARPGCPHAAFQAGRRHGGELSTDFGIADSRHQSRWAALPCECGCVCADVYFRSSTRCWLDSAAQRTFRSVFSWNLPVASKKCATAQHQQPGAELLPRARSSRVCCSHRNPSSVSSLCSVKPRVLLALPLHPTLLSQQGVVDKEGNLILSLQPVLCAPLVP